MSKQTQRRMSLHIGKMHYQPLEACCRGISSCYAGENAIYAGDNTKCYTGDYPPATQGIILNSHGVIVIATNTSMVQNCALIL